MNKRAVELATGDILIGEWVEESGDTKVVRDEKAYVNHHEVGEKGIYLKREHETTYIPTVNILVIRFAHDHEKETIVPDR